MITSLNIKNFRTCRDVSITDASHSTLLIGRNGAGKTNILSALEWVASVAVDSSVPSIEPFVEGTSVSLTLKLSGRTLRYALTTGFPDRKGKSLSFSLMYEDSLFEIGSRGAEKLIFERNDQTIIFADGRRRKTVAVPHGLVRTFDLLLSISSGTSAWQQIKDVHDFLTGVRYYALDDLRSKAFYIRQDEYTSWLQEEDDSAPGGDAVLYRLIRLHEEKKEIFQEIVDILGEDQLNIIKDIRVENSSPPTLLKRRLTGGQVDLFASKGLNSFYTVQFFVPSAESAVVNYQGLSFGTRRILQLIVAMLYDRSTVMLVEQPEDGIHPGLLGKLMRVIHSYAGPTQFFMTSHSPSVVNSVPATDLRIVVNVNGKTRCRPLTKAELSNAKAFIKDEGQLDEYIRLLEQ